MRRKHSLEILTCLFVLMLQVCHALPVHGFSITEPMTGTVYHPGDKVTFIVAAGADETIRDVFLHSEYMHFSDLVFSSPFELIFVIPKEYTGKDMLLADATMVDGRAIKASVEINVVLPAGVVLKAVSVDPKPIYLFKLPPNSDPDDVQVFERKRIGVGGMYTDNVERNITASTDGTTYTSSNEQVVTVNAEGVVTAQGLGAAIITVKNGPHSAEVQVEVEPYKP